MYKRKIEAVLEAWKKEANHKPLVVKGVRQCGKTSSVKQFAYANYEHVAALKFGDYNVGRSGALLTLPFYMWYLLW